jgi:undecaprenyl-diphosphatase
MPRPAQLGLGIQWIKHGAGAGFPSMHAAGAFALAQSMQLGAPRGTLWLRPLIWLLACAVALSRVVLGVHFPSDIVIGALIGCACAVGVRYADMRLTRRHNARQGIAPAPAE